MTTTDAPTNDTVEDATPTGKTSGSARSPWDVLLIATILAALIVLTVYVVHHYATSTDAATILGIVIPAFATIGAAVFGVTVAYNAGTSKGAQKGEANAKKDASETLGPLLKEAYQAVAGTHANLQTEGLSRSGSPLIEFARLVDSGPEATPEADKHSQSDGMRTNTIHVDTTPLETAKRNLEQALGYINKIDG